MPEANPFGFDEDGDWTDPPPAEPGKGPFDHIEAAPVGPEDEPSDDERAILQGEEPPQAPPQEPAAPATEPRPPVAAPPAPLPPASEGQQPGETEAEWVSRYVGEGKKYADDRGLEQGYENALAMQERTAAQLADERGRRTRVEELLRQAATLQQSQPPRAPQPLDPALVARADQLGIDGDQLAIAQQIADAQASARVADMQRELLANGQQAAQQASEEAARLSDQTEFEAFRAAHAAEYASPELAVAALRSIWDQLDAYEDDPLPITARNLEIAYEASKDAALMDVLTAMPDFVDTDKGMDLARRLAHEGTPAAAAPTRGTPAGGAPLPHVEGGGRGPAPDQSAGQDEWAVVTLAKQDRAVKSPLGI
jgi:hypothetical protein